MRVASSDAATSSILDDCSGEKPPRGKYGTYAMLCAATTWLSRSYGAVLGFAWPVAILIAGLTRIQPSNAVAAVVHDVAWGLSRFIPLTYVHLAGTSGTDNYAGLGFEWRLSAEILFFVAYGAIAVWQWQRVEA